MDIELHLWSKLRSDQSQLGHLRPRLFYVYLGSGENMTFTCNHIDAFAIFTRLTVIDIRNDVMMSNVDATLSDINFHGPIKACLLSLSLSLSLSLWLESFAKKWI